MKTTITNSGSTVVINHKGAELISFKSKDNTEYIWEENPIFWGKHSPVLFPIVGTLKNNCYTFNDEIFHLLRHGFARDVDFKLISHKENQAIFSLTSNEEILKVYPFNFELQLCYTINGNLLLLAYKVINKDNITIPFSIGAHPAFALQKAFEEYTLEFDHSENLLSYQLEDDLLSDKTVSIEMNGNKLNLTYSLFEKDALIFKELNSNKITILENNTPILQIRFDDFPHFGIWTKNNAPFICLEPWLGYSDTIHSSGNIIEKEAIQFVDANQIFECQFSMEIL